MIPDYVTYHCKCLCFLMITATRNSKFISSVWYISVLTMNLTYLLLINYCYCWCLVFYSLFDKTLSCIIPIYSLFLTCKGQTLCAVHRFLVKNYAQLPWHRYFEFLYDTYCSSVYCVSLLLNFYVLYRCGPRPLLDPETQQACHAEFDLKQSSFRIGDECVYER